jgi:hypothetical protein
MASWRAYKADTGTTPARVALLAILLVPALALVFGLVRVRSLYVTASEFHATAEVVLLFAMAQGARWSGRVEIV